MGKDVAGLLLGADFSAHSPWKVHWKARHGGSNERNMVFPISPVDSVSLQSIPFSIMTTTLEAAGLSNRIPN